MVTAGVVVLVVVSAVVLVPGAVLEPPNMPGSTSSESAAPFPPFTAEESAALSVEAGAITLRVAARGCDGRVTGAGVLFDGRVVTNSHLVEGVEAMSLSSTRAPASSLITEVGARSETLDLARSGLDSDLEAALGVRPADLAGEDPQVGEPVLVVGWTGVGIETIEARVHLYADSELYGGEGRVMLIDPATTFGYSGGPVLDRDGRVVAILRSVDLATSLAVAIPASEVHEWLQFPNNGDQSPRC